MTQALATPIPVIDFRRRRMVLHWHAQDGTWTPSDEPVAIVHGIAMIRGTPPNVCLYALDGRLRLQIGVAQYALAENSPRIRCLTDYTSLGLRRKFIVESSTSGVLYRQSYWARRGPDFFRWLALKAQDPDWRAAAGRRWTDGVPAAALRGD